MIPSDITNGDWRLLSFDPVTGVKSWHLDLGNGMEVIKTETPVDELFDANSEDYNNSLGKRWGDGQRVASIPLNVYFDKFAEARKQGDRNYIKKLLNSSDYSKFRTFRGNV